MFAEVLILNESEIGDFDHFVTDLGGDSLSVIGVIAQLEEKYGIFISDAEFAGAVNVQQIAELLYKKLYGGDDAQESAPRVPDDPGNKNGAAGMGLYKDAGICRAAAAV